MRKGDENYPFLLADTRFLTGPVEDSTQSAAVLEALPQDPSDVDIFLRKYGSGGEGVEHRELKQWVHDHPEAIGLHTVESREMEHRFVSGDAVDILFQLSNGVHVVVEIETDTPLPGAHQLLKYRVLRIAECGLSLDSGNVRSILVAWNVDAVVRHFCEKYKIQWFERRLDRKSVKAR